MNRSKEGRGKDRAGTWSGVVTVQARNISDRNLRP